MTGKGDLLMIVHRIPYPPDKGDKIRSFNQLKYLAEHGWRVHLCTLADDPDDMRHVEELKKYCASVSVEPLNPKLQKIRSLTAPFQGLPMSAGYFYNKRLQLRVDQVLQSCPITAVFCFCGPMAEYLRRSSLLPLASGKVGRVRCVMDLVDVDSDKWQQYAQRSAVPMKWVYALEGRLLHRYERQVAEQFHATLLVSDAEAETFRLRTGAGDAIHAVSNGVDLDYFHTLPDSQAAKGQAGAVQPGDGQTGAGQTGAGARITFCGAMGYRPNIDAVSWFAREVLPLIRKALGEWEFWIVGGGAGEEVRALEVLPGVRVTGRVEDVRPFVWDSELSVAPIRIARGIQNKVLEAMALGVAALVTPLAFEGLEAEAGRDLVVAPADAEAFATAAIGLLRDPEKRRSLARFARQAVEQRYSWEGRLQVLEELLSDDNATEPSARAVA